MGDAQHGGCRSGLDCRWCHAEPAQSTGLTAAHMSWGPVRPGTPQMSGASVSQSVPAQPSHTLRGSALPVSTQVAVTGVFAALIAVAAMLPPIPVGGFGVPITLQTFAVMLTGIVLGARLGFLAVLLYLVVGLAGLPVFSGFSGGLGVLALSLIHI